MYVVIIVDKDHIMGNTYRNIVAERRRVDKLRRLFKYNFRRSLDRWRINYRWRRRSNNYRNGGRIITAGGAGMSMFTWTPAYTGAVILSITTTADTFTRFILSSFSMYKLYLNCHIIFHM